MSGDAEIAAKQGREDERAPASSSESSGWVEPSLPESSLWIERRAAKSIRRGVVRASARERAHAVVVAQAQRAITTRAATRVWWLAPTRGTDLSPTG